MKEVKMVVAEIRNPEVAERRQNGGGL